MSLLDQLTALPPRESVRAKRTVPVKVQIIENPGNTEKPKVKLSTSAVELIQSKNEYVLFRELNDSLYIVSPSPYSLDGEPNKAFDTRIGKTGRLEITKACIHTFSTDLSKYLGEYTIELVEEKELCDTNGVNHLIKTFKFISNGNSNQPSSTETENTTDGLSHDGSEVDGGESELSDSISFDGGDQWVDELLLEDTVQF